MNRSKRSGVASLELLSYFQHDCLILALNRPESRNAWTTSLSKQLADKLRHAENDPSITAAVITAAGHDAFSVGRAFKNSDAFIKGLIDCYEAIRGFSKPIVAGINGDAEGIGFYVTQLCDYVVAHPDAKVGQSAVNTGAADVFGTWLMLERIGRRAVELALNGRLIAADDAKRLGFVHDIVDSEMVLHHSVKTAQRLAGQPQFAYRLSKKAIRAMSEDRYADAMRREAIARCKDDHSGLHCTRDS